MECTQRLECTQELYASQSERICPEQIGFLGICGTKYPVKKGPNKIGRDPQTCNIVLNLNSISRQHAVINILNGKEFMLMDLDSANKTKLENKTLQPYIPNPLKNGDTVQFGDIFGVFRLLEDDNDLPMTQALDIPDTPVFNRHVSRLNNVPVTTIPESPDVSDRDDSFIVPSQPKTDIQFKSPSNKYIKHCAKTISIQPIGSNKIDNVYWNSSKKSTSLHLEDSDISLNDSTTSAKSHNTLVNQNNNNNIHEMETQPHHLVTNNESTDSIYTAETQLPIGYNTSTSIHNMETQLTVSTDHLPVVHKIDNQQEMQIDLYSGNKENDNSIFNAETQLFEENENAPFKLGNKNTDNIYDVDTQLPSGEMENHTELKSKSHNDDIFNAETQIVIIDKEKNILIDSKDLNSRETSTTKLNTSDEEILFDEVDSQSFDEPFDSQPLLPPDEGNIILTNTELNNSEEIVTKPKKRVMRITSDSSTDCEDMQEISLTQNKYENEINKRDHTDLESKELINIEKSKDRPNKIIAKSPQFNFDDEDVTDCEDEEEIVKKKKNTVVNPDVSFEDLQTQIIDEDVCNIEIPIQTKITDVKSSHTSNVRFEDMPTQIIEEDLIESELSEKVNVLGKDQSNKIKSFEEMDTQVLQNEESFEDLPTQVLEVQEPNKSVEDSSPFKIPLQTPMKIKRKDVPKLNEIKCPIVEPKTGSSNLEENDKYYAATQELLDDLCSQQLSPEIIQIAKSVDPKCFSDKKSSNLDNLKDEPSSVENHREINRYSHRKNKSLNKSSDDKSSENSDVDEKINNFVCNLSNKQIMDVIGVDGQINKIKKVLSDPSDVDVTPKKVLPFKLMATDLPNSQEIKVSVSLSSKTPYTESSSDSEVENESQEQNTPILFQRKKKKQKSNAVIDLTKKFDSTTLPTRIITRLRKPTAKIQDSDTTTKKKSNNILRSKYLTEQEDNIDTEIISENITRLKSKNYRKKESNSIKTKKPDEYKRDKDDFENRSRAEIRQSSHIAHVSAVNKTKSEIKNDTKIKQAANDKKHSESNKKKHKANSMHNRHSPSNDNSNVIRNENYSKSNESISTDSTKKVNNEMLNSTNNTHRSTRSTRSTRSNNKNSSDPDEKANVSSDKDTIKRKRGRPKKVQEICDSSGETVNKRNGRKKLSNENESSRVEPRSSSRNSKPRHEQSTVYNISSESGIESPKTLKRSAKLLDIEVPSPKRTRSTAVSSNSSALRSTPARTIRTHYVLFTAFPCDEVKLILEKLGAVIVTDVKECTMVLTMQIKRTFKLLCAVGLGRPIVGPNWVQACVDTNMIVDPWLYLIKDEQTERRFQFNLERTLTGKRGFLQGFNVSSTPSVMPSAPEMKLIVECSGGTWKAQKPQWICVSCNADRALWRSLKQQGAIIVSSEFILSGVLKQKLDIESNRLDK